MFDKNKCGDGKNTWEHAEYVFGLFWHYFQHQVESYVYWNMVLPEYYFMKHFSHFVKKGAKKVVTKGHWTSNSIVFENPDGEIIFCSKTGYKDSYLKFRRNGGVFSLHYRDEALLLCVYSTSLCSQES